MLMISHNGRIVLLMLLLACGKPTSHTQAIDDGEIAIGMMLVESDGESKLILAACDPDRRCINALQNKHDDAPYYFAALEDRELRHKLRVRGALKLTATIAGVTGLTALGLVSIRHVGKLAKSLRIDPSSVTANTSAAAIVIAILASFSSRIGDHTWGKEERMITKYWDDMFVVHSSFDNAKQVSTPLISLLEELAAELQVKVNPVLCIKNSDPVQ